MDRKVWMQKKTCLFGKNLWEKLLLAVVVIYAVFLAGITVQTGSKFIGEAASYTLTTVSLVNDGNAIISQDDIAKAKEFFPEWAERYDEFKGSSYTTEQGVVPWYFATYPAVCIPAFVILKLAGATLESAFCLTNLACFLLVLAAAALEPRLRGGQRALLCLVLGIHPAIFYLSWPSAEVFQFACIAVASIWWAAGRKHPAALLIAIGGTTNPCILAIGLAMIGEYLVSIWKTTAGQLRQRAVQFIGQWKQIILYGCCYLPGLVPFAYNYSICGAINLTASHSEEWIPLNDGTLLRHLLAYFLDWNFGILPYMPLLLIVWIALVIPAVIRRRWRYLWMSGGLLATMLGYSLMANINCGMDGIARYNAWVTALMAVAVGTQAADILQNIRTRRILAGALACSAVYTGGVIAAYGGIGAPNTIHVKPTPIALKVLKYCPELYWPLDTTIEERSNLPSLLPGSGFQDENQYLRKLYINQAEGQILVDMAGAQSPDDLAWLQEQISVLGEEREIIAIPSGRHIYMARWSLSVENGYLYIVSGQVENNILVTAPGAGYPFLGEAQTLMPGSYTVTLNASCREMPAEAPAQLQVGIKGEDGYQVIAYSPLAADGTATVQFALTEKTENVSCRVYQNDGTILEITGVDVQRS